MPQEIQRNVVFGRTGWMIWYDYSKERHAPIGGGSYNKDDIGSEVNNFRSYRGSLYGFARVGDGSGFNRRRVDPTCTVDSIERVLVLLYATEPNYGGQRLVGWYRNAECHAGASDRPGNLYGSWHFKANVDDAVLLPLDERTSTAPPIGKGGFGESNVRYARGTSGAREVLPWMKDAIAFAGSYEGPNMLRGDPPGHMPTDDRGVRGGQGWQNNPGARKAVETHAMNTAVKFFARRGYHVDPDVHLYQPYDLLCTGKRNGELLRVEVKGTTTQNPDQVWLTAGEVLSARANDVPSALFVVSGMKLTQTGSRWMARGGTPHWIPDWSPRDGHLTPTEYRYRLPRLKPASVDANKQ